MITVTVIVLVPTAAANSAEPEPRALQEASYERLGLLHPHFTEQEAEARAGGGFVQGHTGGKCQG